MGVVGGGIKTGERKWREGIRIARMYLILENCFFKEFYWLLAFYLDSISSLLAS